MAVAKSKPILRRRHRHQASSSRQGRGSCLSLTELLTSPLYILDLGISSLLWLHTMLFQLSLYGVYISLFVFCHATGRVIRRRKMVIFKVIHVNNSGMTHKLERTECRARSKVSVKRSEQQGAVHMSRPVVRKEISDRDYSREDESGYLTDSDRELETD